MVSYLLLILSGLGLVAGVLKLKQGATWAKPFTVFFLVLTFALIVIHAWPDRSPQRVWRAETAYQQIAGRMLARIIAAEFPGAHIAILPYGPEARPAVEALKGELGGSASIEVLVPDLEPMIRDMFRGAELDESDIAILVEEYAMMEDHLSTEVLNLALAQVREPPDVLLSFSSLPRGFARHELFRGSDPPTLILATDDDPWLYPGVMGALRRGLIHGMMVRRRGPLRPTGRAPADLQEAFNERYVWVTVANVDQVLDEHAELLYDDD